MQNSRITLKRKRKFRYMRFFVFLLIVTLFGGASFFAYNLISNASNASQKIYQKSEGNKYLSNRDENITITKDPFSILLVGVENQEGGKGRSDVLLLVTVNPEKEEVNMVSIPRDTRTYLEEAGYETKINHSYSFDEIQSTLSAVNKLIDVPIDYYITTNFDGFEDIVDSLDGIKVDVPFTFKAQLTGSLKWKTYEEGTMNLNGNEALAYVRMRKSDPDGDHGRNKRQQQVIKEIVDKGTSFSSISKIDDIMEDLGENVTTNIPPSKFLSFVKLYSKIKNTPINNLKIEGTDDYIGNVAYFLPEEESIQEISNILNNSLGYSSNETGENTNTIQDNETNEDGVTGNDNNQDLSTSEDEETVYEDENNQ